MLKIFKKGAKVSPPLTNLNSFLCNAVVLSYYDSYDEVRTFKFQFFAESLERQFSDEVMDLLMDMSKNSRAYWRSEEHRNILASMLLFKPCERFEHDFLDLVIPTSGLSKEQKDY